MRRFNIIVTIAALFLLSTSCEDFLEKEIEGQLPLEGVDYTELSAMYQPVSGVLGTSRSFSLISWADGCIERFRTDFIVKGNGIGNQPAMESVLEKYQYTNTEWFVMQPWMRVYRIIKKCNVALDELDKFRENCTGVDLELNDQYKAEVRFLRALAYHRGARFYGDICWFDTEIASIDLKLSPREEVYTWLIGELKDLREDLPSNHPNQLARSGGITRWAADMMLAKAAADIGDYATMEEAAGDIVNNGSFYLYPDYYDLFTVNGELCDENIFELQYYYFNEDGTSADINQWYNYAGMATQIHGKVEVAGTKTFGGGWGFSMPSKKFVDLMKDRGETVRLTRNIIYPNSLTFKGDSIGSFNGKIKALIDKYDEENLPNGIERAYTCKWLMESVDRHIDWLRFGGMNNVRVYRYADALLLYAEALVHNGGSGAGDEYLNMVRERAQLTPISGATIDQIIEERGMELAMEWGGDRFFDLVRLGKTSELGSNFTAGEDEFFPTPQEQIDNHPGLFEAPVSGLFPTNFGE